MSDTQRPTSTPSTHPEPIAIIGIGCHFPGGATSPARFWELLCDGVDATREVPEDRWEVAKFYDPDAGKLGKMSTFRGGYLQDGVDLFDPQFFGISPREAVWLDPQQRLLLRSAWEALEDAGQVADQLAGSDTGVFMGGFTLDYQLLQNYGVQSRYELQTHSATGMMMTMLANRLSYSFDLRGPSLAVDTACSGSLVAVHLAAQAIWNGDCALALAGGVNVMLAPNMTIAECKGGFLAPDGRCKTFDASADGYARGEGAGVVVLKPLSQAVADRDPVYALVRGTATSQDGHTNGITVPNGDSQAAAMRAAYRRAGVEPHEIQYVEAHGTGTPVGDPIEATAIGRVLSEGRSAATPILVGSVKTNLGHLEAAAGVAGLIKTALSLKHGRIPGNLHLREPNPAIPFDEYSLQVPTAPVDWPETDGPRYAGVNSFGFGGTNAHVVLEGPPAPAEPATAGSGDVDRRYLVPLSARSPEALTELATATADVLTDDVDLGDAGFSASQRRTHHDHRAAVVAATPAEARDQLHALAEQRSVDGVTTGRVPAGERPKIAFVLSGMGPQWWAMGRHLLETEPVFRAAVERCSAELATYTSWSLMDELLATEEDSRMAETEVAQTANFAVQVGLAELWRTWGVEPDGIIGHSTGEVAAQYLSGVLSFEDAVKVNYYRSSLQQRATGTGRMLAVGMTPETLNQAVADAGPLVSVAAINSPSAVTLSGDAEILGSMASQLETFGVFHRFLTVKVPYHSHYMDPLRDDLLAGLADLDPHSSTVPLYSTVTGSRIDGAGADAHYWWQNVRATVLFAAAFSQMVDDGYTHFVEVGPHPVLASSMRELLAEHDDAVVVPSLRRDRRDDEVLLESLGTLHCHGHAIGWETLYPAEQGRFITLPTYPWQLKSYWNESAEAGEDRHFAPVHRLLGQRLNAAHPTWELEVNTGRLPFLGDHRIQDTTLVPAAAFVEMMLAAAAEVYGAGDYDVQELELRKALVLSPATDPRMRTTLQQEDGRVEIASFTALPGGERQWTVHAVCQLAQAFAPVRPRDVEGVEAACTARVGRDDFYAQTTGMGFQYGPAFQSVCEIASGDDIAVGRIEVPDAIRADLDAYRFHPSLVDAAFQVLLTAATPVQSDGGRGTPYLPVGIERVRVIGAPVEDMRVVAHVRESTTSRIVADIAVCDSVGRVLVEIEGFLAQSLEAAVSLAPERIDRSLYEVVWRELPVADDAPDADNAADAMEASEEPGAGVPEGDWVVLADSTGVGAETVRALQEAGRRVHCFGPSDVDRTDPEQLRELVRSLDSHQIAGIVHLWSLDARLDSHLDPAGQVADLQACQEDGALSAMRLMQAVSAELGQLPKVWLVTRGAQPVTPDDLEPAVEQAPIWGLGRVIGHQEFVTLWGGLVDLDPDGDTAEQAQRLAAEITGDAGEDQVAFRGGSRYVARLTESPHLTAPFPTRLHADGNYLVTGGLGALGVLVAEFLVDRGARDLVLMGRTPLPAHDDWETLPADHPQQDLVRQLRSLEERGARVHHGVADVADPEQLAAWHERHTEAGLPPVRGVVHTAGVVDDELLMRMSEEKFNTVLRPKLHGSWLLHRLFAEAELDFFVLFSSVGSVIASPGQGNYAAGNAFLDALASYRRGQGLPGLSIGWGPWSVGMVQELGLEQVYARRGIELISPEAGKQVLGRVLTQRPAHLVAITADWAKARETSMGQLPAMFAELGTPGDDQQAVAGQDAESLLAALDQAPPDQRAGVLASYLHEVTALVLGLGQDDFSTDDTLSSLGMDSMIAIEIKHRLEAVLHVEVPVLDLLQGATISALAERILGQLDLTGGGSADGEVAEVPAAEVTDAESGAADELDELLADISPEELEAVLRDLEPDDASAPSPADARMGEVA